MVWCLSVRLTMCAGENRFPGGVHSYKGAVCRLPARPENTGFRWVQLASAPPRKEAPPGARPPPQPPPPSRYAGHASIKRERPADMSYRPSFSGGGGARTRPRLCATPGLGLHHGAHVGTGTNPSATTPTTPPRSGAELPPHPNCPLQGYWDCLLNQQVKRSMRRRHPAPPVTAHRAAPAAPHCEQQQPVAMATGASPSTAGVQTASYAAGSGHSGPKAPPPRSTATTAQIPAQVKVQTATQPRLDHKERERSHPIPTEPPLVRCPLCDDGSSEKPPYVTQRRKRSMTRKRSRRRLGMWWKKYGYGGPPYCQRCSEVFRDHIIRGLSNSAKCTPAKPCLDCKKVLQHFPKSHPLVKG
jgi:hypothetical protein